MLWHDPAIFHLLLQTSPHSQKSAATSHLHQTFGKIPEPRAPLASIVASSIFRLSFSWEQASWGFWTEYISSASWGSRYLMLLRQRRADFAVPHQHYCSSLHRSKFTGWAIGFYLHFSGVAELHSLPIARSPDSRGICLSITAAEGHKSTFFFWWSLSEENAYKPLKLLPRITITKKYRDDSSRDFVYRLTWVKCKFLLHSVCRTHLDILFFLDEVLVSYLNTAILKDIYSQFCSFCILHLEYILPQSAPSSQTP